MTNIALITPGGDAPGMNACIRAVVRRASSYGYGLYGIMNGYQGMIEGSIIRMTARSVGGIIQRGGTILKSSRCSEIKTPQGMKKAVKSLKDARIDRLVIMGGDGSISAGLEISKSGIQVVGIPASIDNDVYGTDETIGFDTAIDTAVEAVDKIRDTATSFDRVFIIEVMGKEHGFIAVEVALASGAEFVLIPEIKYDADRICSELAAHRKSKKTSEIIIFAEGCGDPRVLAEKIKNNTNIDVRISKLGYIQRGGNPTARSRNLACRFGDYAVELIRKNVHNRVVVMKNCGITSIPIKEMAAGRKTIDKRAIKLVSELAI
jgi:6-phosphofructokinase 1